MKRNRNKKRMNFALAIACAALLVVSAAIVILVMGGTSVSADPPASWSKYGSEAELSPSSPTNITIYSAADLIDYSRKYALGGYNPGDTLTFSLTGGTLCELPSTEGGFVSIGKGIGTASDRPFTGTIKFTDSESTRNFSLDTPLFYGISTDAKIIYNDNSPATLRICRSNEGGDRPILAENVIAGATNDGSNEWRIESFYHPDLQSNCITSALISNIASNAKVNISYTNNAKRSSYKANVESAGNVGLICGTMNSSSQLTVNITSGTNNDFSITSTEGNAGGIVGQMNNGAKLVFAAAYTSNASVTATASGKFAGGLAGYATNANIIYNSNIVTVTKTVSGYTSNGGAGGLFGYYKSTTANGTGVYAGKRLFDLQYFRTDTNFVASARECGGVIGRLDAQNSIVITAGETFAASDSDETKATFDRYVQLNGGTNRGGVIGLYSNNALSNSLEIKDLRVCASANAKGKDKLDNYDADMPLGNKPGTVIAGLIGKNYKSDIYVGNYISIHDVAIYNNGSSSNVFSSALVGDMGAQGSFLDVSGKIAVNGWFYSGLVMFQRYGVIRISGYTDLGGGYFGEAASLKTGSDFYGQLVGTRGNGLVYALGSGADTLTSEVSSGWTFRRPNVASDDIGDWGEVLRNITESDYFTVDENEHIVTLAAAVPTGTAGSPLKDFIKTALNIQHNVAGQPANGALRFTAGDENTSASLLADDLSISADIDLSDTGIVSMTRDNGKNAAFSGTFDGDDGASGEYTITLAIGQAYGLDQSGSSVSNGNNNYGTVKRHKYQGLFAKAGGASITNLIIDGYDYTTSSSGAYIGGLVACATGGLTLENVHTQQTDYVYSDNSVRCGGAVGYIESDVSGTISVSDSTFETTIKDLRTNNSGSKSFGGAVGYVRSTSALAFTVSNVVLNGSFSKTNDVNGAISYGGLIGEFYPADTVAASNARSVAITNLTVGDGFSITAKDKQAEESESGCGSFIGNIWPNVNVTIGTAGNTNGVTVGTNAAGSPSITLQSGSTNGDIGALFYKATGKMEVHHVAVNDATISTGFASSTFGFIVNDMIYSATVDNNTYNSALYLTVDSTNYNIANTVVSGTYTVFDEIAAYSVFDGAEIVSNGQAIVSITLPDGDSDGNPDPVTMNGSACNTYQNQTYFGKNTVTKNGNARYYYNLDVIRQNADPSPAEKLLIWSVNKYAHSSINGLFANGFTNTISGNCDMQGFSYYPVDASGMTISAGTTVKFYNKEIEDGEGGTGNSDGVLRSTRTSGVNLTQHYLMHEGIFRNYFGTLTVSGVTLQGNVSNQASGYSGFLICGTLENEDSIQNVSLNNVVLNQALISDRSGGDLAPILINKIGKNVRLNVTSVSTSGYPNPGTAVVASSLIGDVGDVSATNITINFSDIRLDARKTDSTPSSLTSAYGTTKSIFDRATLLNSFTFASNCSAVYNFNYAEDWSGSTGLHHVTYGAELSGSTTVPSESKEYPSLEKNYLDYFGKSEKYINPENYQCTQYASFAGFRPYVYTAYNVENKTHEIRVNVQETPVENGCGQYNDPYIISDGGHLVTIAKIIHGDPISGTSIMLPDDLGANGNKMWHDSASEEHHVYEYGAGEFHYYTMGGGAARYSIDNSNVATSSPSGAWVISDVATEKSSKLQTYFRAYDPGDSELTRYNISDGTASEAPAGAYVVSESATGTSALLLTYFRAYDEINDVGDRYTLTASAEADGGYVVSNSATSLSALLSTYFRAYVGDGDAQKYVISAEVDDADGTMITCDAGSATVVAKLGGIDTYFCPYVSGEVDHKYTLTATADNEDGTFVETDNEHKTVTASLSGISTPFRPFVTGDGAAPRYTISDGVATSVDTYTGTYVVTDYANSETTALLSTYFREYDEGLDGLAQQYKFTAAVDNSNGNMYKNESASGTVAIVSTYFRDYDAGDSGIQRYAIDGETNVASTNAEGGYVRNETNTGTAAYIMTYFAEYEKTLTLNAVREYLAGAYYWIDDDITLPAVTFIGLGATKWDTVNDYECPYAFRGVIVSDGKTITNKSSSPLIRSANGCVVKNVNVAVGSVGSTFTLSWANNDGIRTFRYDDAGMASYGAVIGQVMGGDNIIEKVGVTFIGTINLDNTNTNTTYVRLIPVGGYVGVIVNGGVIFRDMSTVTHTGIPNNNIKFNGSKILTDNGWLYVNPIIGRVLAGYAFYEANTYSATSATMNNGDKNYGICDLNPGSASKLTVNAASASTHQITIPDSQAFYILSCIVNSGAGSAAYNASTEQAYATIVNTPWIGYRNYTSTRCAAYSGVGTANLETLPGNCPDYNSYVKAQDLYSGSTKVPYIIRKYTVSYTSYTDPENYVLDTMFRARSVCGNSKVSSISLADTIYYLYKGFRGIGNIYINNNALALRFNDIVGNNAVIDLQMKYQEYDFRDSSGRADENYTSNTSGFGIFNRMIQMDVTAENSYAVSNFTIKGSIDYDAKKLSDGKKIAYKYVSNTADGINNNYPLSVGGLAGYTNSNFRLNGVNMEGLTVNGVKYVGGLIGWINNVDVAIINNCGTTANEDSAITVTGYLNVGGMIGYVNGSKDTNTLTITGTAGVTKLAIDQLYMKFLSGTSGSGAKADYGNGSTAIYDRYSVGGLIGKAYWNKNDGNTVLNVTVQNITIEGKEGNTEPHIKTGAVILNNNDTAGGVIGIANSINYTVSGVTINRLSMHAGITGGIIGYDLHTVDKGGARSIENTTVDGLLDEHDDYITTMEAIRASGGLIGKINRTTNKSNYQLTIDRCKIQNLILSSPTTTNGTYYYRDECCAGTAIGVARAQQGIASNTTVFINIKNYVANHCVAKTYYNTTTNLTAGNNDTIRDSGTGGLIGTVTSNNVNYYYYIYGHNILLNDISVLHYEDNDSNENFSCETSGYICGNNYCDAVIRLVGVSIQNYNAGPVHNSGKHIMNTSIPAYVDYYSYPSVPEGYVVFADYNGVSISNAQNTDDSHLNGLLELLYDAGERIQRNDYSAASPYVTVNPAINIGAARYSITDNVATLDNVNGDYIVWGDEGYDATATLNAVSTHFKLVPAFLLTGDGMSSTAESYVAKTIHTANARMPYNNSYDLRGTLNTYLSKLSTYNSEQSASSGSFADFAVIIVDDINRENTTEMINTYINVLANTDFNYQDENDSVYNIALMRVNYADGAFSIDGEHPCNLKRVNGQFYMNINEVDTAGQMFSLIDVQYLDPADNAKVAYHLYIPVLVKKMLNYDFQIATGSNTNYERDWYNDNNRWGKALMENLGTPASIYFRYTYLRTSDEWKSAVNNGDDMLRNYDKNINLDGYNGDLDDAVLVLVDPQRGGKTYYGRFKDVYDSVNRQIVLSNFKENLTVGTGLLAGKLIGDGTPFDPVDFNDLLTITAEPAGIGASGTGAMVEWTIGDESDPTVKIGSTYYRVYDESTDSEKARFNLSVAEDNINECYYISFFTDASESISVYHLIFSGVSTFDDSRYPSRIRDISQVTSLDGTAHLFLGNIFVQSGFSVVAVNANEEISSLNDTLTVDLSSTVRIADALRGSVVDYLGEDSPIQIYQSFLVKLTRTDESGSKVIIDGSPSLSGTYMVNQFNRGTATVNAEGAMVECLAGVATAIAKLGGVDTYFRPYNSVTDGGATRYNLSVASTAEQTYGAVYMNLTNNYAEFGTGRSLNVYLVNGDGAVISSSVKLQYTSDDAISKQFPEKSDLSDRTKGVTVSASSNVAYSTDSTANSKCVINGNYLARVYYSKDAGKHAKLYYVVTVDAFGGDYGQLGINPLDSEDRTEVAVSTVATLSIQDIFVEANGYDLMKLTIKLYCKQDNYTSPLVINDYLSDLRLYSGSHASGTFNTYSTPDDGDTYTFVFPRSWAGNGTDLVIPIDFNVITGSAFESMPAHYYSNYKIDIKVDLGKIEESIYTPLLSSEAENDIIYTNARIIPDFIVND